MLCKSCGRKCGKDFDQGVIAIECPICSGLDDDCEHCRQGEITLDRCPREMIGARFIEAVNVASMCGKGDWPVAGGMFDQSAWFLNLVKSLRAETNRVERDQMERANRGS